MEMPSEVPRIHCGGTLCSKIDSIIIPHGQQHPQRLCLLWCRIFCIVIPSDLESIPLFVIAETSILGGGGFEGARSLVS
jgi:hypothetical protein